MRNLRSFIKEEDGMGTVEIVLIIVVLIALVALFKTAMKEVVNDIVGQIKKNASNIYGK